MDDQTNLPYALSALAGDKSPNLHPQYLITSGDRGETFTGPSTQCGYTRRGSGENKINRARKKRLQIPSSQRGFQTKFCHEVVTNTWSIIDICPQTQYDDRITVESSRDYLAPSGETVPSGMCVGTFCTATKTTNGPFTYHRLSLVLFFVGRRVAHHRDRQMLFTMRPSADWHRWIQSQPLILLLDVCISLDLWFDESNIK